MSTQHKLPVIGVVSGHAGPQLTREFCKTGTVLYSDLNYLRRIEQAGGLPLLLPHLEGEEMLEQLVTMLDGLLLTGGEDVDPRRYGQDWISPETKLTAERDNFEFRLLDAFFKTEKPILAICRGFQLVNVSLGGTLIQDMPTQNGLAHHSQTLPTALPTHKVLLDEVSKVARAIGMPAIIDVNSHHHQALDVVASDLRVTGRSEEGVPESFEHKQHPYLVGVQWHPERLDSQLAIHQRLFDDFVRNCENGKGTQ
jgi:putative glutamine amidotransferase